MPEQHNGNMHCINANISAAPTLQSFQGQQHLVVPVVMARANVAMNGASIPESELIPQSWNGVPVTVNHPQQGGQFMTANTPQVLEQWEIGRIFNSTVHDSALKGEAWINVARAEQLRPGIVDSLQDQQTRMDVSTGYFSRHANNQHIDIKPDHLALLPETNGACSWEDGCGVRANEDETKRAGIMPRINEAWNTIQQAVFGVQTNCECNTESKLIETFGAHWNELSYGDTMEQIQRKLDAMDSAVAIHFLHDVFDGYFIYRVRPGDQASSDDTVRMFRRSFTVDEQSQAVMFGDDVVEVQRVESFEPVNETDDSEDGNMPADNEGNPTDEPPDVQSSGGGLTTAGGGAITDQDREALRVAHNVAAKRREELVNHITSNSEMTEDQLQAFEVNHLETIANGIKPKADYGGRAVPQINTGEGESVSEAVNAMTGNTAAEHFGNKE